MRKLIALVAVTLALAGACGDSDDQATASSTTANGNTTTSSADADGTATTGSDGGPSTTVAPDKVKPASTTPSTVKGGGYPFSPVGSYRFRVQGKASSAGFGEQNIDDESVLKVDPPSGTDQHSAQTSQGATTEQVLRFGPDGVRLVQIKTTQQGITKEFKPSPPPQMLPYPLADKQKWSWTATSTDGKTTIKSEFTFDRRENVVVGDQEVACWVIVAHLTTSGDVTSTSDQTLWYAESLRMIAKQHDVTDGKFGSIPFHADTTRTLLSTKPT